MRNCVDDLKKIEAAVLKAESTTSGEIVPIIYNKCCNTSWVFPLVFLILLVIWQFIQENYFPINSWDGNLMVQVALPLLLISVLSLFLGNILIIQRFFISKRRREKNVEDRAELEFYRLVSSKTKNKIGILLFVSLMERYSVVLADESISSKLPPETWNEVLKLLNSKMNSKELAKGFVPAIEKCGELLASRFPRDPQDTNELANYPILRLDSD